MAWHCQRNLIKVTSGKKRVCVVRRRNNLVFRRCYSPFTVVVVCVRCVIFCLFPCFYVSSKESLFFFTAWEAELLNEQTLASNEMQACLQNGGKRRGNFPGASEMLFFVRSFFAASFRTTNDLHTVLLQEGMLFTKASSSSLTPKFRGVWHLSSTQSFAAASKKFPQFPISYIRE